MKLKSPDAKTAPAASQEITPTNRVPLDGLLILTKPDPKNPAKKNPVINNRPVDEEHAAQISKSIEESGLDVPLIVWDGGEPNKVVKTKKGIEMPFNALIAGFHRRRALHLLLERNPKRFKELFGEGVPVVVKSGSLADALSTTLRENMARKNPEAKELLPIMHDLQENHKWSQKDIAKSVGVSTATVSQILSIKDLGEEGVDEVLKGGVSARDAIKAAGKVRKGESSKEEAVSEVKAKAKQKADSGRERAEKRVSAKTIWTITQGLPKLNQANKIILLTRAIQYLAGETDTLPREYRIDLSKASKADPKK